MRILMNILGGILLALTGYCLVFMFFVDHPVFWIAFAVTLGLDWLWLRREDARAYQ